MRGWRETDRGKVKEGRDVREEELTTWVVTVEYGTDAVEKASQSPASLPSWGINAITDQYLA